MFEGPEGLKRRLAVILASNIAGYSRLVGRNEGKMVRETQTSTKACVRKERPLMEAGVVLLDSECRERVQAV
jgi:hypothetical protein